MFEETRSLFKDHGGLIAAGFLLIFFSVFGQSVFFGAYLPVVREELGLSKTTVGSLYAVATVTSSIVIIFTGKALDYFPLRNFLAVTLIGLATGCFVMAHAQSALMLLLAFFLLRQFGQGLMSLSSGASINRYLDKGRGKATAFTSLGGPFHMMIFPLLALTLAKYIDWREAWTYYGFFVLLVLLPGFWFYLRAHQRTTHARWQARVQAESEQAMHALEQEWTRKHVLTDWRFYGIIAISMISPFVGTAIFFYQQELAQSLSLTPIEFAASFPFFTVTMTVSSLATGAIIDKYGEKPALISYPILYTAGLVLLTSGLNLAVVYTGMIVIGGASGIMMTIGGPLIANLYGTKHLASIKSLLFSSAILASALSPFLFGFLLDKGYDITTLFFSIVYYSGVIWLLAFPICRKRKTERDTV